MWWPFTLCTWSLQWPAEKFHRWMWQCKLGVGGQERKRGWQEWLEWNYHSRADKAREPWWPFSLEKLLLFEWIIIKGLDEELAEAVNTDFYESYKTWKTDHPKDYTRQQVNLPTGSNSSSNLDSSVGEELEVSSWGQGNTWGSCWCHRQKGIDTSHCAQGQNQRGVSARQLESSSKD